DTVSHIPRRFVGRRKLALKFLRADAFLRAANEVDAEEPLGERQVCVMENRPGRNAVLIAAINALVEVALFARLAFRREVHHARGRAADAPQTFGPTDALKVLDASLFRVELLHDFKGRRLSLVRLACEESLLL